MVTIRLAKIKARRGTNSDRSAIIFDQGELAYTTDGQRLYVGTGTLSGGKVVGAKIHPPVLNFYSLSTVVSEVGDAIVANNKFYQLTAANYTNVNSWADISTKIDSTFLVYNDVNSLTLATSSISAKYINPASVSNGVKIENGIIQSNYNTKSLEISATQLSLKVGGIDEREINSTTFINGLSGGSGGKIGINYDPTYFCITAGVLSLTAVPPTPVIFSDLDQSWFGPGLVYDSFGETIQTLITNVDTTTITKNISGVISMVGTLTAGREELTFGVFDQFGRIVNHQSSIYSTLTGNSTTNSNNTLSSIFNGTPAHSLSGAIPGLIITQFQATDMHGNVVSLSSAGFITFEGNTTTRTGQQVGRFAIPIFAY